MIPHKLRTEEYKQGTILSTFMPLSIVILRSQNRTTRRMHPFQWLLPINPVTVCITISAQRPDIVISPVAINTVLRSCDLKHEIYLLPGSFHSGCCLNPYLQCTILIEIVYTSWQRLFATTIAQLLLYHRYEEVAGMVGETSSSNLLTNYFICTWYLCALSWLTAISGNNCCMSTVCTQ